MKNLIVNKLPKKYRVIVFIVLFAVVGGVIALIVTHASSPTASIEAESGTVNGPAIKCSDANASGSGSNCVQFKAASSGGGLADPLCTWDGVANQQYPCLTDTGIPVGTTLHTNGAAPNDCPTTINTAAVTAHGSSTWTGCHWTASVTVTAANVTIQNSYFTGGGSGGGASAAAVNSSASNVIIKYSLIDYGGYGVSDIANRYATSGCSGGEATYLSNGTFDHSVVVGWSDGPRLGSNETYSNDYLSGCGLESRGDHADIFQSYQGGCGNIIDHSTLEDGNSGYKMDSADVTFAADGGCGFTVNNTLVVIGSSVSNTHVGIDMRGDDMHGTVTITNNVFQMVAGKSAINCTAGDGTPGPLTYVVSGNKKTDGTAVNTSCTGHN
ncbi:MAG: hypothetical protein ACREGC_01925 [Minisyncoccia bacterium]